MPTTKNATIRYQALDRCLINPGRRYNIDDLVEACNDALTDFDPSCSGVRKRQVYDDPNFSINNQPLKEQEAQQLREAILTLSRFKGLPQFKWIEEMQLRLEYSFNLKNTCKAIEFEENP